MFGSERSVMRSGVTAFVKALSPSRSIKGTISHQLNGVRARDKDNVLTCWPPTAMREIPC
jgi:hypothetical protein